MELKETKVTLRHLVASDGKIIISKETTTDVDGREVPVVKSKEIYLGKEDSEDNYIEIDDTEEENNE